MYTNAVLCRYASAYYAFMD